MAILKGRNVHGACTLEIGPILADEGEDATAYSLVFKSNGPRTGPKATRAVSDWAADHHAMLLIGRAFQSALLLSKAHGHLCPAATYESADWVCVAIWGLPRMGRVGIHIFVADPANSARYCLVGFNASAEDASAFGLDLVDEVRRASPKWWEWLQSTETDDPLQDSAHSE